MGTNEYLFIISVYFCSFLPAAASAAEPAADLDTMRLLAAIVSVTVTSQLAHFPSDKGIWVTPSGRFPSDRTKPWGYYYYYYLLFIFFIIFFIFFYFLPWV